MRKLTIDVHPQQYCVCRWPADAEIPVELFARDGLVSITRTESELSVIVAGDEALGAPETETGWRRLSVRGPLEFELTGIMSALASALAAAGVTLFALSTFDTDHLLVKDTDLERARTALLHAGHQVSGN